MSQAMFCVLFLPFLARSGHTIFRGLFMPMMQKILRRSVLALTVLPVLSLGACGEGSGWTTIPYDQVPYTHERTAGRGVAYVRAAMLPPKEMKTEIVIIQPEAAPIVVPAPLTQGDKIFEEKQGK